MLSKTPSTYTVCRIYAHAITHWDNASTSFSNALCATPAEDRNANRATVCNVDW